MVLSLLLAGLAPAAAMIPGGTRGGPKGDGKGAPSFGYPAAPGAAETGNAPLPVEIVAPAAPLPLEPATALEASAAPAPTTPLPAHPEEFRAALRSLLEHRNPEVMFKLGEQIRATTPENPGASLTLVWATGKPGQNSDDDVLGWFTPIGVFCLQRRGDFNNPPTEEGALPVNKVEVFFFDVSAAERSSTEPVARTKSEWMDLLFPAAGVIPVGAVASSAPVVSAASSSRRTQSDSLEPAGREDSDAAVSVVPRMPNLSRWGGRIFEVKVDGVKISETLEIKNLDAAAKERRLVEHLANEVSFLVGCFVLRSGRAVHHPSDLYQT